MLYIDYLVNFGEELEWGKWNIGIIERNKKFRLISVYFVIFIIWKWNLEWVSGILEDIINLMIKLLLFNLNIFGSLKVYWWLNYSH